MLSGRASARTSSAEFETRRLRCSACRWWLMTWQQGVWYWSDRTTNSQNTLRSGRDVPRAMRAWKLVHARSDLRFKVRNLWAMTAGTQSAVSQRFSTSRASTVFLGITHSGEVGVGPCRSAYFTPYGRRSRGVTMRIRARPQARIPAASYVSTARHRRERIVQTVMTYL